MRGCQSPRQVFVGNPLYLSMSEDAQAAAQSPSYQGPVKVTEEGAEKLESKRQELFEEFDLHDEFPPEVLREAQARVEGVTEEIEAEAQKREDLRELTAWTTDPSDAEDFDDAISIQEEEDAYRLWVHIADVTHYVNPDTQMWEEAVSRCNTIYLPGHVMHMLPSVLAETVCSLVPQEDRLAHTVEMEISKETLSFESVDIYKSVIRSNERLTYNDCERRLDDEESPLHEENTVAYELANQMHEQRKEDGSLVLNPRRDRAHTIIEESMLKANKAVTHVLMWDRGLEAMYRVHPQPTPDQWSDALQEIQELNGVSIPGSAWDGDDPRKAVNGALEESPERQLDKIQRAVLKVMPRAKYMNDPFGGHHALNFDIYGHFTSPIRRLSDLINHWIVDTDDVPEELIALCDRASDKQKDGDAVERIYKQEMEDMGIDPHAVNNRGMEIVDDPEEATHGPV